jgi:hypothetical protein
MKKKSLRKHLILNKKTVANLDEGLLGQIKGGSTEISVCIIFRTCDCPTVYFNCTTQDPNQICVNTCNCPNTSVGGPCKFTECNC